MSPFCVYGMGVNVIECGVSGRVNRYGGSDWGGWCDNLITICIRDADDMKIRYYNPGDKLEGMKHFCRLPAGLCEQQREAND